MSDNCFDCNKEIGLFTTIPIDGKKFCTTCAKKNLPNKSPKVSSQPNIVKEEKNLYKTKKESIQRALSALLTQDSDTKKLFEEGSRTYLKIFGGDINNFINLNANLIQASILLKILEKMDSIEQKLTKLENKP